MFKINAEPTFPATLTLVGQGREQALNVVFRHHPVTAHQALLEDIVAGKTSIVDAILVVVESWDADSPLDRESVRALGDQQPGADWAILNAYSEALAVARKKN